MNAAARDTDRRSTTGIVMTAPTPGAIAIVQIAGEVSSVLRSLTGEEEWPIGRLRLVKLDDLDEGLAVRIGDDLAQLMPHGGPRIMQRLTARLRELGAEVVSPDLVDPLVLYPEAEDDIEARMLATLARAASPMAIELLLVQPRTWRALAGEPITREERERSARLNRLVTPPLLVLAGPPNVGKSTLSNALLGRSMSIAVDMPGTTRDYTRALIELDGLVVQWHDTPGLRSTDDPIEAKAMDLARRLMDRADLLIAMTDAEHAWPDLPRQPDLRVVNKIDLPPAGPSREADVRISARTGDGLAEFVRAARNALVPPEDLDAARTSRWVFDEALTRP